MRSLRISMYASEPIILPLAYNELLHGLIYNCWRKEHPELHDVGFRGGSATYRFFTFGPLRGKGSIDSKRRTYRLEGPVAFEVRSPLEDLLDVLASELACRGSARIGAYELPLVNLDACDRLLFPRRALIRAVQPIVASRSEKLLTEQGDVKNHTVFLSPEEDGWASMVQRNAAGKANTMGLTCGMDLQIIPLSSSRMRRRVTRFKGSIITGWKGEFALSCDPQLMQLLYSCGLGSKNSEGFGMFEIDDRPL